MPERRAMVYNLFWLTTVVAARKTNISLFDLFWQHSFIHFYSKLRFQICDSACGELKVVYYVLLIGLRKSFEHLPNVVIDFH